MVNPFVLHSAQTGGDEALKIGILQTFDIFHPLFPLYNMVLELIIILCSVHLYGKMHSRNVISEAWNMDC